MDNKRNFDINREWKSGRLPIINGILYEDGSMDCINIDFDVRERTVEYIRKVHINELLSQGEIGFSYITVNNKVIHLEKQITVYCGEGSYGGDGFVVVQSNVGIGILWIAFFETANPFISIEITDNTIYAINNLKEKWSFNIDNPKEINIVMLKGEK